MEQQFVGWTERRQMGTSRNLVKRLPTPPAFVESPKVLLYHQRVVFVLWPDLVTGLQRRECATQIPRTTPVGPRDEIDLAEGDGDGSSGILEK